MLSFFCETCWAFISCMHVFIKFIHYQSYLKVTLFNVLPPIPAFIFKKTRNNHVRDLFSNYIFALVSNFFYLIIILIVTLPPVPKGNFFCSLQLPWCIWVRGHFPWRARQQPYCVDSKECNFGWKSLYNQVFLRITPW